jgi:peptidoglycan/LPS O-acetylase OafA/YrhL
MLGIVAADVAVRKVSALRWSLPGVAIGIVAGQLQGFIDPATDFADRFGWHLTCFCLVATIVSSKRIQSVLAWRPLAAIGVASYSIYLIHDPLVTVVENISPSFSRTPGVEILFVSLSLIVGSAFYFFVERPLQNQAVVRKIQWHGVPLAERLLRELGFSRTLTFRHQLFSRVGPLEVDRLQAISPGSVHGDVSRERVPNLA